MIQLYGKENDQSITIDECELGKLKTVKDMYEDTQMDSLRFHNIPFEHLMYIKKYLIGDVLWRPISFCELAHLTNTVNFLNFSEMLQECIDIFVEAIKVNTTDSLRTYFEENHNWSKSEYQCIQENDMWCQKIPSLHNTLLKQL